MSRKGGREGAEEGGREKGGREGGHSGAFVTEEDDITNLQGGVNGTEV